MKIIRKYVDSEGRINFYMNKSHFITLKKEEIVCNSEMNKIETVTVESFINTAFKKRKSQIKRDENKGNTISIIPNDEVFDCILFLKKRILSG